MKMALKGVGVILFLSALSFTGTTQSLDFQNTVYYTLSGSDLVSAAQTLSAFNFSTPNPTHPLYNDGVYYPVSDVSGNNLWVRVRHTASDPNGITVGHNVTATSSSPFRSGGFGGWWGFLYQFDIYRDIALTGARGNKLNGTFKTTVMVESIETLSDTEWVFFEILDDLNSAWVLNSINFTGVNPSSNPGFNSPMIPYNGSGFSGTFPGGANTISVIDLPGGGFSEFSMSANFVSSFKYGYEYGSSGGYQGMRLSFGIAPLLPTIISFTPTQGIVGTLVAIEGTNFDPVASNNIVKFNGTSAEVVSGTTTSLVAIVPQGATTGPITVTVGVNTATSGREFTVLECPVINAPFVTDVYRCGAGTVELTASGALTGQGYRWYAAAAGGPSISSSATFATEINATTPYYVSIREPELGCESPRAEVNAVLVASNCNPAIAPTKITTAIEGSAEVDIKTLVTTGGVLDLSSLAVVTPPASGAQAFITEDGILQLNYDGIAFSGTESITIAACNSLGNCTQQVFQIEVVGDIIVYNGLSPNGDDKNDYLLLEYIDVIPATARNRVVIYNRWGDAVWDVEDYNNTDRVFTGLSKNGKELPAGTYFYKIEFAGGRKTQTGHLTLKR